MKKQAYLDQKLSRKDIEKDLSCKKPKTRAKEIIELIKESGRDGKDYHMPSFAERFKGKKGWILRRAYFDAINKNGKAYIKADLRKKTRRSLEAHGADEHNATSLLDRAIDELERQKFNIAYYKLTNANIRNLVNDIYHDLKTNPGELEKHLDEINDRLDHAEVVTNFKYPEYYMSKSYNKWIDNQITAAVAKLTKPNQGDVLKEFGVPRLRPNK